MALGCHRFVVFGVRYFQSLCWWLAVLGVLLFRLGEGFMIFQFGVFVFFNNVMFCAYLKFCGVDSGEGMEGIGRDWKGLGGLGEIWRSGCDAGRDARLVSASVGFCI